MRGPRRRPDQVAGQIAGHIARQIAHPVVCAVSVGLLCAGIAAFAPAAAQSPPPATGPTASPSGAFGVPAAPAAPAPRSAIPWLNRTIEGRPGAANQAPLRPLSPARPTAGAPPPTLGQPRRPDAPPTQQRLDAAGSGRPPAPQAEDDDPAATPAAIEVTRLKAVDGSGAGLLAAKAAGLPQDAWRGVSPEEATAALGRLKPGPYRSANAAAIRLISAALPAPRGANGPAFFTARLEALSRFGAADAAARLAEAAGPDLVGLGADAALVAGREEPLCAALIARPSAQLARIFCQAAAGDAYGAGLSMEASRDLGDADEISFALIEAVADRDLTQDLSTKHKAAAPTPVRLAAFRALGLPLPSDFTRNARLALLPAALAADAAPRLRLEALERLEESAAASTDQLREAFAAQASAESGGVWGRVEAYRGAVEASDPSFAAAVEAALGRARNGGRSGSMARLLAPSIAARALPAFGAPADPALLVPSLRAALRLGGEAEAAAAIGRAAPGGPDLVERAMDRIISPGWPGDPVAEDRGRLAQAADQGDRRAAFASAALDLIEGRPTAVADPGVLSAEGAAFPLDAGAPPRVLADQRVGGDGVETGLAGARDPRWEIASGRAALLATDALAGLGEVVGPGAPGAFDAGLTAIEVFLALGWEQEARRLAVEIAATL